MKRRAPTSKGPETAHKGGAAAAAANGANGMQAPATVADESVGRFIAMLVLRCVDKAIDDAYYAEGMRMASEQAYASTRYSARGTARGSAQGHGTSRSRLIGFADDEGAEPALGDFEALGEYGIVEELRAARDRGNAAGFISGQEAELVAELRAARLAAQEERKRTKHEAGRSVKEWFWFDP